MGVVIIVCPVVGVSWESVGSQGGGTIGPESFFQACRPLLHLSDKTLTPIDFRLFSLNSQGDVYSIRGVTK